MQIAAYFLGTVREIPSVCRADDLAYRVVKVNMYYFLMLLILVCCWIIILCLMYYAMHFVLNFV